MFVFKVLVTEISFFLWVAVSAEAHTDQSAENNRLSVLSTKWIIFINTLAKAQGTK